VNAFGQDVDTQATAAFVRMWRECGADLNINKADALMIFKVGFIDGIKEGTTRARDMLNNLGESSDKSD